MPEQIVKLQRFFCVRRDENQEGHAEAALWTAAKKYHGTVWPEVARFYQVRHFEEGSKRASALTSIYEHVVLCG